MTKETPKIIKQWRGTVVSDAADKTISVEVNRFVTHPKYHKKYNVTKKYAVHDPSNKYSIGDTVAFSTCAPISKNKRFVVIDG